MDQIIPLPFTLSGNMVCREVTKKGGEILQLLQVRLPLKQEVIMASIIQSGLTSTSSQEDQDHKEKH